MRGGALLGALLASGGLLVGCVSFDDDAELAFQRATEACAEAVTGKDDLNVAADLATQAAILDPRWRALSQYASSVKAASDSLETLDEEGRQPGEVDLDLAIDILANITKFDIECRAIRDLASDR